MFWSRYFRSPKTVADFYCDLFGIPVLGASFPVAAVVLIGIYGKNIFLIISAVVLRMGHIESISATKKNLRETISRRSK